jgi:putative DNA modification/repair radical SAM protein
MSALSIQDKLSLLGEQASFDVSAPSTLGLRKRGSSPTPLARQLENCIYPAAVGGGRCLPVLKVLLTNACRNNCRYCAIRSAANVPRAAFTPAELARAFMDLYRRRLVQGIFLSSGVAGDPDDAQALIVDTATILRRQYDYQGYIHLKILPGVSEAAIEATVRLASRVSLNLEAPSAERLAQLAPDKDFASQLLDRLRLVAAYAQAAGLKAGVTTQFVAGAAGESDAELLATSWHLYRTLGLRRAYYSGFTPIPDSPLENVPPMPTLRQHRLYQADWLLRQYGFSVEELVFQNNGMLALETDPKLAWALAHPEFFPVELTTAGYEELLRIPGVGPLSARRLIAARRVSSLRDARDLAALGLRTSKLAGFATLAGRRLTGGPPHQLCLPLG